MISELSTPKTQAQAFSYFAVAGNIGIFLGPLLGGGLVEYTKSYLVQQGNFWDKHTYSLPGICCGIAILIFSVVVLFFVNEVSFAVGSRDTFNGSALSRRYPKN
jgi:MFS family permease